MANPVAVASSAQGTLMDTGTVCPGPTVTVLGAPPSMAYSCIVPGLRLSIRVMVVT